MTILTDREIPKNSHDVHLDSKHFVDPPVAVPAATVHRGNSCMLTKNKFYRTKSQRCTQSTSTLLQHKVLQGLTYPSYS